MSEQYVLNRLLELTEAGGIDRALPWLKTAAKKNYPDALYILGHFYETGLVDGTPSVAKARKLYQQAAMLGYLSAQQKLTRLQTKKAQKVAQDIAAGKFVPEVFKKAKKKKNLKIFYDEPVSSSYEMDLGTLADMESKDREASKTETPKAEAPKAEAPKAEAPKTDKPKKKSSIYEDSYDPLSSRERLTIHEPDEKTSAQEKLDALTGMRKVKDQLALIQKRMEFDLLRKGHGLETKSSSNHFVFKGNPGTGKTEIARIMGQFFREQKVLSQGHVVEVERADIVGGYIGKTAHYTKQAIEEALGGILFVDEAHSLFGAGSWDFGPEAISTILKGMEDHRGELVVVMAGYPDLMEKMLRSNPGLKSRIRNQIDFPDFNAEELLGIFEKFCREENYILHDDARARLKQVLGKVVRVLDKRFGNGRFARNVYEVTVENMARRVVQNGFREKVDLQTILFPDIPGPENLPGIDKKAMKSMAENISDLRGRD